MGMFDRPALFSDHFKEGEAFNLQAAKVGPEILTDFGKATPVLYRIGDKWFSAIGQGLLSQVEQMDKGDLPARVMMVRVPTKNGQNVKRIVPVDSDGKPVTEDEPLPF